MIDAVICLRALAEFNPSGQKAIYEMGGVPPVLRLITSINQDVQMSAIDAILSFVRSNQQIKMLVQGSIVNIVNLLSYDQEAVRAVTCGVLMELARDNENCQEIIFKCDAVTPLIKSISCNNEYMQFHGLGIITFLILKNDERAQSFMANGLEEAVHKLLDSSENDNIKTGATVVAKIITAKKKRDEKQKGKKKKKIS